MVRAWGVPNKQNGRTVGVGVVFGISQRDIPNHCLQVPSFEEMGHDEIR